MRVTKKWVAAAAAAALTLTSLPAVPAVSVQAADSVDQTVRLQPWNASTFNDTNGDGLGEFEGWGTSLCWWANRIGYSDALTSQAAELFFSDEGLDMNIGRYNVGGGDATGEVQKVPVNENAQFYDLTNWGTNPTGAGSSMSVDTYTKMQDITYSVSDADFGLTKGEAVGSFQKIGWINKLDDEVGSGDNLRYTVEVDEAGTYTVKLMMALEGTNDRDVAIRVNEGENQADYVVDADTVNSSIVAEGNSGGSNCMLFIVTIPNVELQAGVNTINIAGKNDWTLDFVKMAVIKSGEEGVLPAEDEFTLGQIRLFEEMTGMVQPHFPYKILRHILNSAGIERFPQYAFDMVRMGIGLYGIGPLPGLRPVSTFKTHIASIRRITPDQTVGYGRRGRVSRPSDVAVIPVGYADGLDRHLSCGVGEMMVRGQRVPVLGNICMDACMLDVTGTGAQVGDEVEIFGHNIPVTELSDKLGTIPYEVLTSISRRVRRLYFKE